jgi:hypothetical protein
MLNYQRAYSICMVGGFETLLLFMTIGGVPPN